MNSAADDVAFFSGSRSGPSCSSGWSPAPPDSELVEHADVSRTTVHRALSELYERVWARRVDDGYVATPVGELALETYRAARARFATLREFEPFLSAVDRDDVDFDLERLSTAELETPTETAPRRAFERYADRLETIDGDGLRGTTGVMNRSVIQAHGAIARGEPTTLVLGEETFRSVRERFGRQLREALAMDGFDLYVTGETPSIGLTLYGVVVFLGAYDDGRLVACVESDDGRLRRWAETRFERLLSGARQISSDALTPTE